MSVPGTGEAVADGANVVDEDGRTVERPEVIEGWVENIRQAIPAKKPPVPGTVKTPDDVIRDLDEVDRLATQHAAVLREAERTARTLAAQLERARAKAYKNAQGTVDDRKAEAVLKTTEEADAADTAEIVHNYAKSVGRLIDGRGSHVQTQSKLVELTYHLAGRRGTP